LLKRAPRDALAARAIVEYPDLQEYQVKSIQEAVEEADSLNVKFLEHDEVVEHMKKLGYG
jgi:predicted transcriptional regulator